MHKLILICFYIISLFAKIRFTFCLKIELQSLSSAGGVDDSYIDIMSVLNMHFALII